MAGGFRYFRVQEFAWYWLVLGSRVGFSGVDQSAGFVVIIPKVNPYYNALPLTTEPGKAQAHALAV